MYHYAGNNPVKYLDPDGNQVVPYVSWDSFWKEIFPNSSSGNMLMTMEKAINSDVTAQSIVGKASREAAKESAITFFSDSAAVTYVLSCAVGGLSTEALCLGDVHGASICGTASLVLGAYEVFSLSVVSSLTGDSVDREKYNSKFQKYFAGAFFQIGFSGLSKATKSFGPLAEGLITDVGSRFLSASFGNPAVVEEQGNATDMYYRMYVDSCIQKSNGDEY